MSQIVSQASTNACENIKVNPPTLEPSHPYSVHLEVPESNCLTLAVRDACGATFGLEHLLFSLTLTRSHITITCTCYDVINESQGIKIYSHVDSLFFSVRDASVAVRQALRWKAKTSSTLVCSARR